MARRGGPRPTLSHAQRKILEVIAAILVLMAGIAAVLIFVNPFLWGGPPPREQCVPFEGRVTAKEWKRGGGRTMSRLYIDIGVDQDGLRLRIPDSHTRFLRDVEVGDAVAGLRADLSSGLYSTHAVSVVELRHNGVLLFDHASFKAQHNRFYLGRVGCFAPCMLPFMVFLFWYAFVEFRRKARAEVAG